MGSVESYLYFTVSTTVAFTFERSTVQAGRTLIYGLVAGSDSMTLEFNVYITKELQGSLVVDDTKVLATATKCALLAIIIIVAFDEVMVLF